MAITSRPVLEGLASDAASEPSVEPRGELSHSGVEQLGLNNDDIEEVLEERDKDESTAVLDFELERQRRQQRRETRQVRRAQRWRIKTINRWVSQSAYVIVDQQGNS